MNASSDFAKTFGPYDGTELRSTGYPGGAEAIERSRLVAHCSVSRSAFERSSFVAVSIGIQRRPFSDVVVDEARNAKAGRPGEVVDGLPAQPTKSPEIPSDATNAAAAVKIRSFRLIWTVGSRSFLVASTWLESKFMMTRASECLFDGSNDRSISARTLAYVTGMSSGITIAPARIGIKFASPCQRGTTC
jgi:hypothetical protein